MCVSKYDHFEFILLKISRVIFVLLLHILKVKVILILSATDLDTIYYAG